MTLHLILSPPGLRNLPLRAQTRGLLSLRLLRAEATKKDRRTGATARADLRSDLPALDKSLPLTVELMGRCIVPPPCFRLRANTFATRIYWTRKVLTHYKRPALRTIMATDYTFEGWVSEGPSSVDGKMIWKRYEPKAWEETDIDIRISHSGICGSDIHTLRDGWVSTMSRF